ncbi:MULTISPECIES: T9SS type A sorting domain-containing protein [unclassified Lentimicrobium]|uniref:T9SS type A sorting domain-containing protein n=1 Tax=unclassified Lentimicrobium TaxID=2677434 RepID=UPI0015566D02|nr:MULTISPECIES: T9SS type A sorting domain-containing protein [unclassified Lentimicrobium]NPD46920.1 T9SS type A sorting domain-containing protein [Lentimicrobium sp. S6]NPD84124.1 T9SS type A sorting domain-containing protein [Lentimicrobium sp. L6]
MKKAFLYLSFLVFSISAFSQSCLPGDNYFSTQADIDNFLINHPDCTTIEGNLMIMGDDITNLNGLQNISTFESGFWIDTCPLLENLSGIENVSYVGDYLEVASLPLVENIDELSNVTFVGGALDVMNMPLITNLNGLENIVSSPTHLLLWSNPSLTDIEGARNLQSITTLLSIKYNTLLSDISPLQNIDLSELSSLTIKENPQLSSCHINSICLALEQETISFTIENNLNGCNTIEEIESSCSQSISTDIEPDFFSFYPNPAQCEIVFSHDKSKNIQIFNQLGQLSFSQENITKSLNISTLEPGIYIINIESSNYFQKGKLIIQ